MLTTVTDVLHRGNVQLVNISHDPLVVACGGDGCEAVTDGGEEGVAFAA